MMFFVKYDKYIINSLKALFSFLTIKFKEKHYYFKGFEDIP